jgi:hypothetical protein
MVATSIHYSPVKASSEIHNNRLKKLDYVRDDLSHLNQSWQVDTIQDRLSALKSIVKAKTGRKMQKKATPIREAVVVVKQDTSMNELKQLANAFRERWGIDTFQIHLHKDEGHWRNSDWKGNYHAHFVTDFIDHKTGKSIKLNRQDMAEMQTITAEVLGMERGVSSSKKHLSAIQFKLKAEQERLKSLENEIKKARELLKSDFKARKNILGVYKAKDVESLLKTLKMAQIEIENKTSAVNQLQKEVDNSRRNAEKQIEQLKQDLKYNRALYINLLANEETYKREKARYEQWRSQKQTKKTGKSKGFDF